MYDEIKRRIEQKMRRVLALVAFASALLGLLVAQAVAETYRWDGTSPFCDGACGNNETEITRLATSPGSPPAVNTPPFGAACVTGTKALCLSTPPRTCRWDGTAPFCEGGCRNGEARSEPPPGSSSGNECLTGSKVYCCRIAQPSPAQHGASVPASYR